MVCCVTGQTKTSANTKPIATSASLSQASRGDTNSAAARPKSSMRTRSQTAAGSAMQTAANHNKQEDTASSIKAKSKDSHAARKATNSLPMPSLSHNRKRPAQDEPPSDGVITKKRHLSKAVSGSHAATHPKQAAKKPQTKMDKEDVTMIDIMSTPMAMEVEKPRTRAATRKKAAEKNPKMQKAAWR